MFKKMPDGSTIPNGCLSSGIPVDNAEQIAKDLTERSGWSEQAAAPILAAVEYARRQEKSHILLSVTWHNPAGTPNAG